MKMKLLSKLLIPLVVAVCQSAFAAPTTGKVQIAPPTTPGAGAPKQAAKMPSQIVENGLMISRLVKNGVVNYIYQDGRLSQILGPRGEYSSEYFYTPAGKLDHIKKSTGSIETPVFDASGALVGLKSSTGRSIDFTPVRTFIAKSPVLAPEPTGRSQPVMALRAKSSILAAGEVAPKLAKTSAEINAKLIETGTWEADSYACQMTPDGEEECFTWPPSDDPGTGGGNTGGGDYGGGGDPGPIDSGPGGGGDEGGGGGVGNMSELPPGGAPSDPPNRLICMANAYIAYNTMIHYVCRNVRSPRGYANCMSAAMTLYSDEMAGCRTIPD